VMPLLAAGEAEADGPQASILKTSAEMREITPVLQGGGLLESSDTQELTIPAQVKLERYLVGNGDVVAQGDPIAEVDRVSVMTAITQVQQTLEDLSADMEKERTKTADTQVTALAGGTVKVLYAQPGESVVDVMLEHGALAVLSLDNQMAVKISAQTDLTAGDRVKVMPEGKDAVMGTVVSNLEGALVVTVADKGYAIGTPATLAWETGEEVGKGILEVYSPWKAVGYSGTISTIPVREGQKVSSGQTLIRLTDTGHTARYYALAAQRQEYEELLQELFRMQGTGVIIAPCGGIISGVDPDGEFLLDQEGTTSQSSSASMGRYTVGSLSSSSSGEETQPQITTELLPTGTVGKAYTYQLKANVEGGTWSMDPLPESFGLVLDSATGILSGTPQKPDQKDVTVYYIIGENPGVSRVLNLQIVEEQPQVLYTGYAAKVTEVVEGYLLVQRSETAIPIASLEELPGVSPTDEELTVSQGYLFSISPREVSQGDTVLLVFENETLVKVVRQGGSAAPEDPGQSSGQPGNKPGNMGDGAQGGTGDLPSGLGGFSGFGGMGGFGSLGMSGAAQEEDTLYPLDTLTVAVITSQEEIRLPITVDEGDVLQLREGQSAEVTVDAMGGERLEGEISRIAIIGTNDGGRTKFTVTVDVERSADMYPGMTGSVRIPMGKPRQVVAIPVAALTEENGKVLVYTGYDEETGTFTGPVEVTTGLSDGEYVQITGLDAGDQIWYAYYDTLEFSVTPESGGMFGR